MATFRMGSKATSLSLAAAIATPIMVAAVTLASAVATAQELATPPPASTPTPAPITPARGSSMEDVKAKFGAPSQEVPAIGQPPITRWEYPGYVVFFENDKVLHTVLVRS